MKASILTIGDEILNGTTVDTNSAFIAQNCEALGLGIGQILSISDTYDAISNGLDLVKKGVDIIFITGGLGPTKDDITKQALADYFETKLVFNQEVFSKLAAYFAKRGNNVIERNRKLAMIPGNCSLVANERGTALGMWFESDGKIFVSMPGVPHEMKRMLEKEVLPRIVVEKKLPQIYNAYIMTAGIGESSINEKIEDIEDQLPNWISLAFLPSLGSVKLRLTGRPINNQHSEEIVKQWQSKIAVRLKKYVYSNSVDISLAEALGALMVEQGSTIGTAESCTGGYIGHMLTKIPGSSRYYEGSIVSYSYDIKEELLGVKSKTLLETGAVSKETVEEMLKGLLVQMKTTYGIAVSGIAGPGGGMPGKPVGTVWIAVGDKTQVVARRYQLTKHRQLNIEITGVIALNLLRRYAMGELSEQKV